MSRASRCLSIDRASRLDTTDGEVGRLGVVMRTRVGRIAGSGGGDGVTMGWRWVSDRVGHGMWSFAGLGEEGSEAKIVGTQGRERPCERHDASRCEVVDAIGRNCPEFVKEVRFGKVPAPRIRPSGTG